MRVSLVFAIAVLISFALDTMALPRASWRRAPSAWALHILAMLFLCAFFTLLTARPLFSALCAMAILAGMSVISNPKFATLREPFVFSDLGLYVQAFRHPRFYLPFADVRALVADGVGIVVLVLLYWFEPPIVPHPWLMSLLAMAVCLALGYWVAARLPLTLDAAADQRRHGFFTVFVAYLLNGLRPSTVRRFRAQLETSPFADSGLAQDAQTTTPNPVLPASAPIKANVQPDVIVIQSESYFDARRVSPAIDPSAYVQFDRACRESVAWGELTVPAWGANTMRSEFSFLTGVASEKLGYARFYPYVFLRRACASLPGWFQRRGYRTLALHPYHANFFERDRVFPLLHFDRFLDIAHFNQAPHAGPYVADAAVTDAIFAELDASQSRHFIFSMTMENHGPLHLETVRPGEARLHHTLGDDVKWNELTIYLRHVVDADAMIGNLLDRLQTRPHPTVVCFYGDHVPALSPQFRALGVMPQHSAYFIWRNFGDRPAMRQDVPIETLSPMVLAATQA